ncbi:hypothetical protein Golob_001288 [Gossypium lobatum]|uniref:Uncharacterized protein n=1 Tax=Gossypium lobatum TaxID=34289 RepID=A0A7J8NB16_9ROSI|nr:hypothetical protein [Gossypium lobatum]
MEVATTLSISAKHDEHRLCREARKYMNKEWEVITQYTNKKR